MTNPKDLMSMTSYQTGTLHARSYRSMTAYLNARLAPYSLTSSEWAVLGALKDVPKQLPSELAATLDVSRPFIAKIIASLDERGFTERGGQTADRRMSPVCLSEEGVRRADEIEADIRQALREYLADIPREKLASYLEVLSMIAGKDESERE